VNGRGEGEPLDRTGEVGIDQRTLRYYEENAETVCARYEAVDLTETLDRIVAGLPAGARILELGSGSGRDAAYLLRRGFDVVGLDGSAHMVERAVRHHPELEGRLHVHPLPAPLPFVDDSFEAVVSLATLMHLEESAAASVLAECRRVLARETAYMEPTSRPIVAVSVPARRGDVGAGGRDNLGRRFMALGEDQWKDLVCANKLEVTDTWRTADAGGRIGITWMTIVAARRG